MAPDERALRAALESAAFQSGADGGRWRLVDLAWPIGIFAVTAAARPNSPSEYGLRIDLSSYPQQPPTATPWDLELDARLTPRSVRRASVRSGYSGLIGKRAGRCTPRGTAWR